ncbi:MAG: hypothetical protein ACPLXS_01840 [Candidatus Micrarchaeales archaeon]
MEREEEVFRWYIAVFVVYELLAFIAGVASIPLQLQQFANNLLVGDYLVIVVLLISLALGFEVTRETRRRVVALTDSLKFGIFAGVINALVVVAISAFLNPQTQLASLITQEILAIVTFSLIGSLVGSFIALALESRERATSRRR